MNRLALFPLQLVLFPNVPLPLHIFEERYRTMITRCIDEDRPFGVVYHRGESIREVGCTAIIDRVIKRYDDGRLDIIAVGHERFTIDSIDRSGLYLEADIRLIDDPPDDGNGALLERAVDAMLKYAYYAELTLDRSALRALTTNQLSYLIAGVDLLGMDTKQELLEIEPSDRRLELAVEALDAVTNQLAAVAQVRKTLGDDVDLTSFTN
ncbi:MAG: LON peptidase substrate-binding domain-containing protein [Spirochaetota bacterium]